MGSQIKKTIVVIGATGNQGGSVARTFLELPNWHVRCLTRNPSSEASQALRNLGAEIVKGSFFDPSSLSVAFEGAHAIFLNTDFFEVYHAESAKGDLEKASQIAFESDYTAGKNVVLAAANLPSLERLVYTSFGPIKDFSKGKYSNCYHWNSKVAISKFIENEQPELAKKTSYIYMGCYMWHPLLNPKVNPVSGRGEIMTLPGPKEILIPMIDPKSSTGPFVRSLVEDEVAGVKLLAYGSYLAFGDIVDTWSKVTGKEAGSVEVPMEVFQAKTKLPSEYLDGMGFVIEFGYAAGIEGLIEPDQLKTKVKSISYEEWLKEQK